MPILHKLYQSCRENPDNSVLLVLIEAGQSMTNIQSNIKLVISGTAVALLIHPNAVDEVLHSGNWGQAFLEYA